MIVALVIPLGDVGLEGLGCGVASDVGGGGRRGRSAGTGTGGGGAFGSLRGSR